MCMSVLPMNIVMPTPMPVSGSPMRARGTLAGVPDGCPGSQLPPPLPPEHWSMPAPFSRRRQLLVQLHAPRGNIRKYLSTQAVSSARVLRVPDGTVSHIRVLLADINPAGFKGWVAPPSL